MSYTRSVVPSDSNQLKSFLEEELDAISVETTEPKANALFLTPLGREPAKRVEGMIVYANGLGWDPGFGRGVYAFNHGAWSFLG